MKPNLQNQLMPRIVEYAKAKEETDSILYAPLSMFPVHNFSHDFNHDLSRVSLVCEFVMISSAAPSSKRRELVGQSPMVHEVRQCDDDDATCDIFPGHDNSCCHERRGEELHSSEQLRGA